MQKKHTFCAATMLIFSVVDNWFERVDLCFDNKNFRDKSLYCLQPRMCKTFGEKLLMAGLHAFLVSWCQIDCPTLLQIPLEGILRGGLGSCATRPKRDFFFQQKIFFLDFCPHIEIFLYIGKEINGKFSISASSDKN